MSVGVGGLTPVLCPHAAGWSSLVARRAHNPKVVGSNPTPATIEYAVQAPFSEGASCCPGIGLGWLRLNYHIGNK